MRIVIDTNIWISGLLWSGAPWQLLRLAELSQITICMSPPMLQELRQVLAYPLLQPRIEQLGFNQADLIAYVLNLTSLFQIEPIFETPIVTADPNDDMFLVCAITAQAKYVVSGDRHLLDLANYENIPIIFIQNFFQQEFPEIELN